jgi:hypothetical protein
VPSANKATTTKFFFITRRFYNPGVRKRKHSLTVALAISVVATAAAQNPPPRDSARPAGPAGTGSIRGRVVTADREPAPIRNARVSISEANVAEPVFTDDAGRFALTGIRAGRYQLVAEKTGFARTRYGTTNPLEPPTLIAVADGAAVNGVDIRMPRGASISGRVLDENGDAVVGATVSAAMPRSIASETRFGPSRSADTDDRGIYRLGDLPAGRYIVNVGGAAEGSRIDGRPAEWARTTGWARTFYPGAPGPSTAAPVVVGAGEDRAAIDITLAPSRPARLTLSLVDGSGRSLKGLVNLFMVDEDGMILANRGVPIQAGGTMTPTLEPGEWIAALLDGGKAVSHVTVASGDETSLIMTAGAGARISGQVVFDGSSTRPPASSLRLAVRGAGLTRAAPPPALANGPATIQADGSFAITGVVGTIEMAPASSGRWLARSVTYNGRDLIDESLTLSGNEDIRDVRVVYTDRVADLRVVATDADGRPSPGCLMTLFAAEGSTASISRRARLVRADQSGRMPLGNLLPGSYFVLAASNIDANAWPGADYLERLRPLATRVTVDDRASQSLALTCGSIP